VALTIRSVAALATDKVGPEAYKPYIPFWFGHYLRPYHSAPGSQKIQNKDY